MKNRLMKNSRGQVFIISVVIAVTIALGSAYILLNYMFENPAEHQELGVYQSAMIDSVNTGDKLAIYLDSAYALSLHQAVDDYLYANPKPVLSKEDTDGAIDESDVNYCGNYIYRVWNSENKNCYPDYRSKDFELNDLINENMAKFTYQYSTEENDNEEREQLKELSQPVYYDYKYVVSGDETIIQADPSASHIISLFANDGVMQDSNVQQYLEKKYEGGEGDIPGIVFKAPGAGHYAQASNRKIDYIVLHYTAGHDIPGAMSRFLSDEKPRTSSHYIVGSTRDNFQTIQVVLDKDISYHGSCDYNDGSTFRGCAKPEYKKMNTKSLGIEIVNLGFDCDKYEYCRNDPEKICTDSYLVNGVDIWGGSKVCWQKYPDEQYKNLVSLVALLAKKHDIPIDRDHIIGHSEIINNYKYDPGAALPLDKLVADVRAAAAQDNSLLIAELANVDSEECIKGEDTNWDIERVDISSRKLTSDQEVKFTFQISNTGKNCVNIKPRVNIKYFVNGKAYDDLFYSEINAHVGTEQKPFAESTITCKFTADEAVYKKDKTTSCVILVPSDGRENKYTASMDAKDYNGKTESYGVKLEFDAMKSESGAGNIVAGDLSEQEKKNIEGTKERLENLGIMEYIGEMSQEYGVPRDLILGLITRESAGNMKAGSVAGAYGLMQVTKPTFDGTSFKDKCTWEEYQKDSRCQIRAGVAIMKVKYAPVADKTIYYSCGANKQLTQYTGWEAMLRRYNGGGDLNPPKAGAMTSGCTGYPDFEYVEKVMRYADGWGYSGSNDQQVKEEINHGILGVYTVKPVLSKNVGFDFKVFDLLVLFAKDTSKKCGSEGSDKISCISSQVSSFNTNLPAQYKTGVGMRLNTDCATDPDALKVHKLVDEMNDCMLSSDDNCGCTITTTDARIKSINSMDGTTVVEYYDDDEVVELYLDYEIRAGDASSGHLSIDQPGAGNLVFSKSGVLMKNTNVAKKCSMPKTTYRFCLDTNYKYTVYNEKEEVTEEKFLEIPFAISVRDSVAPKQIMGVSALAMQHSKNSIIVKWTPGIERDITNYNIYIADSMGKIDSAQTKFLKEDLPYKSLVVVDKPYESYNNIDVNNPICISKDLGALKYCEFKYNAVDLNGQAVAGGITLEKEKLYYISSENKFMYILDGSLDYNELSISSRSTTERFIAVTAVDIDGNEINNLDAEQKLEIGKNVINIMPQDLLELAMPAVTSYEFGEISNSGQKDKTITISWTPVNTYIDGTTFSGTAEYIVYAKSASCTDSMAAEASGFEKEYKPYSNTQAGINIGTLNLLCAAVGAVPSDSDTPVYDSVITKSLNNG